MIHFCIRLQDQLITGKYEFFRKVLGWPSSQTISEYNSVGGNEPDGILYSFLQTLIDEFNLHDEHNEWMKMVSLKWDAFHVSDRIKYIFYTDQIVGVTHDSFEPNVLMEEFNKLDKKVDHKEKLIF